jgi:hypothetical protein
MLADKGYADHILSDLEVEGLVDEILSQPMPEFDGRSIIELLDAVENGLDFCLYVGFTVQRIQNEAFAFMGRRSANLPVLLRGDKTLPEEKRHFTAMECQDELHMKCVQVNFSELKLNAHLVEDALQTRMQCYPLGVRLWQEMAMGQGEKDKPPEENVAYKVFVTYSFGLHASACTPPSMRACAT